MTQLEPCDACGACKGERCLCKWMRDIDSRVKNQGEILQSARREIMRKMDFAKRARRDAVQDGNAALADFHWGVYSGLAQAAGIAFRELRKSRVAVNK